MKKTLTKVLLALATLSLVACGSSSANVSNADEALISGSTNVTKGDVFSDMKKQSGAKTFVLQEMLEIIAVKEEIDVDTIKADCQADIDEMKEENPTYIEYYGEETLLNYYISSQYEAELISKYIDYNYDSVLEEYPSYQGSYVAFASEEDAKAALDKINAGLTFEAAVAEVDADLDGSTQVFFDDDSSIPVDVKEFLNSNDSGVSDVITVTSSSSDGTATTSYYLVNLVSKNVEDYKDDFIDAVSSEIESATVYNYYFEKYDVQIYDQDIYTALAEVYDSIK